MEQKTLKIVISGPESTGKTELAGQLSGILQAHFIPEYARSYVESLPRKYTYGDVEHIAVAQLQELNKGVSTGNDIIILDTYLVITKIWFLEVFGRMPDWIDAQLAESGIDLFLLCYYDIKWVKDPLRENPGPRRKYLFNRYKEEIARMGVPCETVSGMGPGRLENAKRAILLHFPHLADRMK